MTAEHRVRGRPRGTGKNDSPHLAQVADLLVRDATLKPTTAMKCVMATRKDWGATDTTLLRRWQSKWKSACDALLLAARERITPKAATIPGGGGSYVSPSLFNQMLLDAQRFRDMLDPPHMRMIREQVEQAQRMQDLIDPPHMRMIREQMEQAQRMQDLMQPSYLRALRGW